MNAEQAVYIVSQTIWTIIAISSVLILPSLIVGLIVAVIQAVTQINEQTMSFLPRLLTTLVTIALSGHWAIQELSDLFNFILSNINNQ
ncbi:flagellar biosynthesis protein FliQ [Vibrio barjaei]|uniref:flagellar biosynthesis protein FliQ n=1 Tax=Vibrio barjaei TaxID=1676683 RepID=UPI0022849F34|nr:flagellar biosynthesis protein FliQ [Vibrio barjaei]MCY9872324.1 flagellar biosynthesis protein FliQ [Vibrio barjaei]